jgi:O-antigen ligase
VDLYCSAAKLTFFLFSLLCFVLPFAVAPQNIIQAIFIIVCLWVLQAGTPVCFRRRVNWTSFERILAILILAWVLLRISVGLFNDNFNFFRAVQIFIGYLPLIVVPWLTCEISETFNLNERLIQRFLNSLFAVSALWCLVSISQRILGWAFYGGQLHFERYRSFGLYSHPLTLAYVLSLLFPFSLRLLVAQHRQIRNWVTVAFLTTVLILNESRTVQLASAVVGLSIVCLRSTGRVRLILTTIAVFVFLGVAAFENPIRTKFIRTYTDAQSRLTQGDLPDDRLIFWTVHLNLAKERPWFGWGAEIPDEVRIRAYDNAGYSGIKDKYNAHNLYLQALVEGGVGGLMLIVSIFTMAILVCRNVYHNTTNLNSRLIADGATFSLITFMLASFTQNSIYDSEVRFSLTLLFTAIALSARSRGNSAYKPHLTA